jgi:hypothetical protein
MSRAPNSRSDPSNFEEGKKPLLRTFPTPLPDELMYSIVSRRHFLVGNQTERVTFRELFDSEPFSLTSLVPHYLDRLAEKLPGIPKETERQFLNHNTLLPLYQTFFSFNFPDTGSTNLSDFVAPAPTERILKKRFRLRICIECVLEDFSFEGTPYIHRAHHIPGVFVCWKHGHPLLDRCPNCHSSFGQGGSYFSQPWQRCVCKFDITSMHSMQNDAESDIAKNFAIFARDMLHQASMQAYEKVSLREVYRYGLERRALNPTDKVSLQKMISALKSFYGENLWGRLISSYGYHRPTKWFNHYDKRESIDTAFSRHLLKAFFLFRRAEEFWATVDAVRERAQDHYYQPARIASCALSALNELKKNHWCRERVDYYWRYERDLMKRFSMNAPRHYKAWAERISDSFRFEKERIQKKRDEMLAGRIEQKALSLYATIEEPSRITHDLLLKAIDFKRKKYPDPLDFPLTVAKLRDHVESDWHYYARRILWAMLSLKGRSRPNSDVIEIAAINSHRALVLLNFFRDVDRVQELRQGTITNILVAKGISKSWKGLLPEEHPSPGSAKAGSEHAIRKIWANR